MAEGAASREMEFEYNAYEYKDLIDQKHFGVSIANGSYTWYLDADKKRPFTFRSKSPEFSIGGKEEYKWQLSLTRVDGPNTMLILRVVSKPKQQKVLTLFALDLNGVYVAKGKALLGDKWYLGASFLFSRFFDAKSVGSRTITVRIGFEFGLVWSDAIRIRKALAEDLNQLLHSRTFSDIELRATNGVVIPVHKMVIAARSEFFSHLLERSRDITSYLIEDFDSNIVWDIASFMYTGSLTYTDVPTTITLMEASLKFGIPDLMTSCGDYLASSITQENALLLYRVSRTYPVPCLQENCVRVFFENREEFSKNEEYRRLLETDKELVKLLEVFSRRAEVKVMRAKMTQTTAAPRTRASRIRRRER